MTYLAFRFYQIRFRPGLGGAYDVPPDSTVGWGGAHPLPISMHVQTSLDAFSVSPTVPRHFHSRLSVVSFLIKHITEKTRLHKDFLFSFRRNHAIRLLYHF